ncbi:putative uncharacterized protein C7orf78 [Caloenas nicobarica]|uniref:putative uncharacterized protein C7orf78 n=1 Tax=Caloenas nicobarica TaxID=187106 RepID=UPI0032B72D9E
MFTLQQGKRQFSFESQTKFSVSLDWPFFQQQTVVQQPKANTNVWLKQPPDFSYWLYKSCNPSQKPRGNGNGELKPKMTSESIVVQQLSRLRSRLVLLLSEQKTDLPQLVTRFPRISSYEAKILFMKNGKYKTSVYEDPKLHDYRQTRESKWDPRVLLPKYPWPPKSASFTRHRRRRGAHTVFSDRVEEKLCQLQQGEAGRDEPQPKQHGAEKKAT